MRRLRYTIAAAAAVAIALIRTDEAPPTSSAPSGGRRVAYTLNAWSTGFMASIAITDTTAKPVNGCR